MIEKSSTVDQFNSILENCRDIFQKKTHDYGTSWRILRLPSLTDQILIKAQRIRSIQEKGKQKIVDSIQGDFIGIINYSIIALMQHHINNFATGNIKLEMSEDIVMDLYDNMVNDIRILMIDKNHDYGEAWRSIRVSSITDLILQKLIRIKSIEDNNGKILLSEGIEAGYQDMVNYSIFSLILMKESDT